MGQYYVVRKRSDNNELYHYGVPGMKWGVRRAREHAGPGRYVTRKRQLAGDKRDLRTLEKGGHLSVGVTKKRQAALDKRDKAIIEKRIAKNDNKSKKRIDKEAFIKSADRGKQWIKELNDPKNLKWDEDKPSKIYNKMTEADWKDVDNYRKYQKQQNNEALVASMVFTMAAVPVVMALDNWRR